MRYNRGGAPFPRVLGFFLLVLLVGAGAGGCAHPMVISPDIDKIEEVGDARRIPVNAGYLITAEQRNLEVTTAGGGGDKVSYKPYADIETAWYKMLGVVFTSVNRIDAAGDLVRIKSHRIEYVMIPSIETESSSSSVLTWPPTRFVVNLTCVVQDVLANPIARIQVQGTGHAEFDEFKADASMSGRRAMLDAILKMRDALLAAPELRR